MWRHIERDWRKKHYVSTEGYPIAYSNNQDCRFVFVAQPGERIAVVFEDVHLEIGRDLIQLRKSQIVLF